MLTRRPCCAPGSSSALMRCARGAGRGVEVAGCVAPAVLLALLPKCPMCLAAYVALWTGIGLSTPAAGQVRAVLMVVCAASVLWLGARCVKWVRAIRRESRARSRA